MTLQAVAKHEYEQAFLRPHNCAIELRDDYDARRTKAQEVMFYSFAGPQGFRKQIAKQSGLNDDQAEKKER